MKKYCFSILFYCIAAVPCFSQMCQTQGALIRSVSINAAGYPEITWSLSMTADATRIGYLVYDYLGGAACSSLIGETGLLTSVYTHTAVPLPLTGPRSYTVAYKTATDPGPLTRQHAYSFLQAAYDSCTYAIALQWTPYEGWDGAVTYNVYGAPQGDPPVLRAAGHTATTCTLANVPDNVSYDIYVVALHPTDTTIVSVSNRVTVETKTAQRPLSMSISSIEYIDDAVTLQFAIDPTTRLSTFHLTRSDRIDGGYIPIHTFSDKTRTTFTDAPVESRYYYRLTAENYCRIEAVQGNPWQNIPMTMEAREGAWHLTWHADFLFSWLNTMIPPPYTLKRLQPQPATLLNQTFDTTCIDAVDLSNAELTYCYRVEGVLGAAVSATEVCQTYRPQMIMPDAIAPNSVVQNPATGRQRNQFGPIVYANPTTYRYRLEIYTRNGDLIAAIEKKEADLPTDKSWTGMNRYGSPVQEGVYLYNVQLSYTTGQTETHTGAVTVVYE